MLLLFRQPFRSGDQIKVVDQSGTVTEINIRETRITTFDGESVIIPNRDVYKNVILVHTHHDLHRLQFDIGIAYDNDAEQATRAIVEALSTVAGVEHDPPPEALVYELGVSTVNIRALLWTDSRRHESITVLDAAIKAVKSRLDRDGIEMPANIVVLQATPSFRAAIHGDATLTPAGNLRPDDPGTHRDGAMNLRISSLVERLRSSLFFVPMLAVIVAAVLAFAGLAVDRHVDTTLADLPLGFTSTVESARTLLGVIAGATISFAGIAFSVSLLIIQLASSQYSPRVVHTLFRDPFNKRVMALVVGTFTYCVVVLRSVRSALDPGGDPVIPNISVAIAVVLGIATILAIVAFINHSAHAMDVSEILERIRRETTDQIRAEWTLAEPRLDHRRSNPAATCRADDGDPSRPFRMGPTDRHRRARSAACQTAPPPASRPTPAATRSSTPDSSPSRRLIDAHDFERQLARRVRDRRDPHHATRRHLRPSTTRRRRRQSTLARHQRPHHRPRRDLPHRRRALRTAPPRPATRGA